MAAHFNISTYGEQRTLFSPDKIAQGNMFLDPKIIKLEITWKISMYVR